MAEELGKPSTMTCRKGTQQITWLFVQAGTTSSLLVAANCQLMPGFSPAYLLDNSDDACNLIVTGTLTAQAGTYTCQDATSSDMPHSAVLVLLGTICIAKSNVLVLTILVRNNYNQSLSFIPVAASLLLSQRT